MSGPGTATDDALWVREPGRRPARPAPTAAAGPEMSIQEVFETSLVVVRDRRGRFASNKVVPNNILCCLLDVIDSIVSAFEKENSQPFTLKKCFLDDLAVKMTRAWEAYSIDESGQITCLLIYFELSITNNLLIRKCIISCWISKSQRICESSKDHSLNDINAYVVS